MSSVSSIRARTLAISVFPTPACPSTRSGFFSSIDSHSEVAMARSATYASRSRRSSSSGMAASTDLRLKHACARGVKSLGSGYPVPVTRARRAARMAPKTALARSSIALVVGLVAGLALSVRYSTPVAILGGWNAGGLALLGLAWLIIATADAETTGRRAAAEDPGRKAVTALVLLASLAGFLAVTVLVRTPEKIAPREEAELVALCLLTVALSWTLTHTAFTLRYAHLYY